MATSQVLVVGSLNMDLVVRVERQPEPGDTVLGSDVTTFPGGKGANQAAAAAKAGAEVRMLGRVGSDGYGQRLKTALEDAGVDTSLVKDVPGPSGLAFITVDKDSENMIVVSSGANRQLSPDAVQAAQFEGVGVVLMQLESPIETVSKVAEAARALTIPVVLNAAPAQTLEASLLRNLSYLIVNEGEAALLSGLEVSGVSTAQAAAERLLAQGVGNVIVTLGSRGVAWVTPETRGHLKAHEVEVVDTTAAGDSFCGAFAAALVEGKSVQNAAVFANAAGALAATKEGAQPSLPTRAEIEALSGQPRTSRP